MIEEKRIFALTLYFESGSTCPIEETLMLAWVIKNRVKSKKFPDNYISVCTQRKQFSCWNGKTMKQILKIKLNKTKTTMPKTIAEISTPSCL